MHALFQQRVSGDDALLRLARLRFAQMGVSAEVYADTPDQLEHVLRFAPAEPRLPVVHMNRGVSLLQDQGREAVREFAGRFAGRITGLVVHDRRDMGELAEDWLAAMRELDIFLGQKAPGVTLFVEYAAGLELGRFTAIAEHLRDAAHVSICIDVGHVGIRQAGARFAERHPDVSLGHLGVTDARLPGLVADVQDAVGAAVGDVCEVIRSVGRLGKPVHFHLHDGHPLVPGLADHFSFLTRLPIPFSYEGRRSLSTLYGPGGLDTIVSTAIRACPAACRLLHDRGSSGRRPAAARRRRRPVRALAGHHERRADELLAQRAVRERAADLAEPGRVARADQGPAPGRVGLPGE